MSKLIKQLAQIRLESGLRYEDLAAASGLHPNTVHNTLTGKNPPSLSTLEALAAALNYKLKLVKSDKLRRTPSKVPHPA